MAQDVDDELVGLRRSRELLRRAHELAGIGSFVIDLSRRTIHMSAELVHLFRAGDEAIELPLDAYHRRFCLADDLEPLGTRIEAARQRQEVLQLESRVIRGDGQIIWSRTTATFETSADGEPLMVGVVQDITLNKRALFMLGAQVRKLERTTERLELATDAAAIGTWDWDVVTGAMRWDATMFGLYGIRREDFVGTLEAWMSRVCPVDRDRVVSHVQAAVASASGWVDEFSICRPDGSLRVLKSAARIVRDAAGAVVRMVGVNYDATTQRRAEESLVASEALLLQLVRHTPAAVAMFDREMRYLQTSDRWISDYHLVGLDLFGRSHYEVFPEIPQRWKEVHQRALAGAVERCKEDPFPRADGTTDWLEWEIQPWRTAAGDIGGVIMFTQVITERIRAEERLRESEARFRQIAETIGEVFWVRDPVRDEFLYVSPAFEKVWGRPADDLTANAWPPAVHVDDRARVTSAVRALATDGAYDETYRIERPDGVVRWIRDRAFPLRDPAGNVYRIVGTASDITAQRDLEAQLRQAQKMEAVGVLAGGVAHDFNNLLAVILSYSSLLLEDLTDGHPMRADLHEIKLAGERAGQLTRQLLAFSRQQVLQPRVVDLNEAVAGTEKMLRRLIGEDIELVTTLAVAPARAFIDPGQFEQVLMNLAVNARDAMPDGGRLRIDVARREVSEADAARSGAKPGWFVVLTVADSGAGMDAATQSRIFEPFFTTKAVGKGTGLGLSTVFGIIEQSGGHIEVQSVLDNGTTFRIWLPLAAAATSPTSNVTIVSEACAAATILVVEDEDAVRKLASRILIGRGFRVLEARSAVDALLLCEQHAEPIDLVLTDVVMPGMSGDQLAARLRALRPEIRVAFMSGYPDRIARGHVEAREIHIAKPFTPAGLLKPIVEALARPAPRPGPP